MSDRYDQDAILAYVEGDMPGDARLAFEQQLERDEALRHLVTDLMSDRDGLRELARDRAPSGLVDAAIGHLERRMLLDTDAAGESSTILAGPIPLRAGKPRRLSRTRWLMYGGIAATIAVSGAVMWQTLVVPEEAAVPMLASRETTESRIAPATPEPMGREQRSAARTMMHGADEPPPVEAGDADTMATGSVAAAAPAASAEPVAAADAPKPEAEPMLGEPVAALADAARPAAGAGDYFERSLLKAEAPPIAAEPAPQPPQVRVLVAARNARLAEAQVLRWAVHNNASIVTPLPEAEAGEAPAPDTGPAPEARANVGMASRAEPARRQALLVEMPAAQVDELVTYLNAQADQRATVEPPPPASLALTPATPQAVPPPADAKARSPGAFQLDQALTATAPRSLARDEAATQPPPASIYKFDWDNILQAQLPLAPVKQLAPADPSILPPRRVSVLVEVSEVETLADEVEPAPE